MRTYIHLVILKSRMKNRSEIDKNMAFILNKFKYQGPKDLGPRIMKEFTDGIQLNPYII